MVPLHGSIGFAVDKLLRNFVSLKYRWEPCAAVTLTPLFALPES